MSRHLPINELIPTLGWKVLFAEEGPCAFRVIVRAILMFLRDSVVELILQTLRQ